MKTQPLPDRKNIRASGVLMHISSLPSPWGTGDLGPGADRFADFLASAGQRLWQVLPLSPTEPGQGNSPYSGLSAFAGNTVFISPEILAREGLLDAPDLEPPSDLPPGRADYDRSARLREPLFRKAFASFSSGVHDPGFSSFCEDSAWWLDDFVLFTSLKNEFGGSPWYEWPAPLRYRESAAMEEARKNHAVELEYQCFLQYMFSKQWERVRNLCADRGLKIMGDLPVYVSLDSSDVWANRHLFDLDSAGRPRNVAGVPPDYFSPLGQRWGNPVYRWDVLEEEDFGWWLRRLEHAFTLFDMLRIDHFRGLVKFWSIPAAERSAVRGSWVDAAPEHFFEALMKKFPLLPVLAENLGVITPDVTAWVERLGVPGMLVLQFAFGEEFEKNPYAPANHIENACVYTGTHDNNTSKGWFETEADPAAKRHLTRLAGHKVDSDTVSMEMIGLALASKARLAIFPMQDVLGLGAGARFNTPGTSSGNWLWRVGEKDIETAPSPVLAALSASGGRNTVSWDKI